MAQITFYLDDELAEAVRKVSKSKNMSQSRVISDLVREGLATQWPDDVVALWGAWDDVDFPTIEEIREGIGEDAPREVF